MDEAARVALLIAAHGERSPDADNEGVKRIARAVSARGLVSEVAVGFINGVPTIGEAFAALTAPRVIVYPLFASSGYFTRDRLVQLLDEANGEGRNVEVLPPLGLDPGFPDLVLDRASRGRARTAALRRRRRPSSCWPMARGAIRLRARPPNRSRARSNTARSFEASASPCWRSGRSWTRLRHSFKDLPSWSGCSPARACTAPAMPRG